jgi:hypothetical protein
MKKKLTMAERAIKRKHQLQLEAAEDSYLEDDGYNKKEYLEWLTGQEDVEGGSNKKVRYNKEVSAVAGKEEKLFAVAGKYEEDDHDDGDDVDLDENSHAEEDDNMEKD